MKNKKTKISSKEICKVLTDNCVLLLTPVLILCGKGSISYFPSHKTLKLSLEIAQDYSRHLISLAKGVICVYNLLSPDIWERYSHYDAEFQRECEEVVLLNNRKKDFLAAWQKRPGVLRKCQEVIS
jgi:hypothetical protein